MARDVADIARAQEHLVAEAVLAPRKLRAVGVIHVADRLELLMRGRDQPGLSTPHLPEAFDHALEVTDVREAPGGVLADLIDDEDDIAALRTCLCELHGALG